MSVGCASVTHRMGQWEKMERRVTHSHLLPVFRFSPAKHLTGAAVSSDNLELGTVGGDPLGLTLALPVSSSGPLQETPRFFEPWFPVWVGTLSLLCPNHRLVIESQGARHRGTAQVPAPEGDPLKKICQCTGNSPCQGWHPPAHPCGLETSTSERPSPHLMRLHEDGK